MNTDHDMEHTTWVCDDDAREKYLAGKVLSTTNRKWMDEFFKENADLPKPKVWEVWAGPGSTLWTLACK